MLISLILGVIAAFIIGLVIGLSVRKSSKNLSTELDETKKLLTHYQNTINEHVHKTHEIMENIYQQFSELQKHSQEYSVKLNLDPSRQSLLQPKAYRDKEKTHQLNNEPQYPKDYAAEGEEKQ
ncbi:DUF1043 family protein [Cysteiniphilum sp. QT6929]|uniref:ZapG family protein n=1 Tax=Cysteiniphilum sp. QT6929 TaxID=2975055 RepID=UPI0024B3251E|nr:DUF1043 family protein [Cysteiniphilum sp. QT6929]WHN64740.1 YhcB family protein [Cysteiniphilum sp. QT6929]